VNSIQVEKREKLKIAPQSLLDLIINGLKELKSSNSNLSVLAKVTSSYNKELIQLLQLRFESLAKMAMSDRFDGDYGHEEALRLVKQAIELKGHLQSLKIETKLSPSFINSLKQGKFVQSRYHSHRDVRELILKELSNQ
jgi:hypothetical protein